MLYVSCKNEGAQSLKCFGCGAETSRSWYYDKILNLYLDAKCAKKYLYKESRDNYTQKYYEKNSQIILARNADYRRRNHALVLKRKKIYRDTHQDVIKRNKAYYIVFKDRRLALPYQPRIGECSSCHRTIISGQIKKTNMHHKFYDENDPGAFIEELCVRCHNNRR